MQSVVSLGLKNRDRFRMCMSILSETVVFKVFSSVEIAMFSTFNHKLKDKDLCLLIFTASIW